MGASIRPRQSKSPESTHDEKDAFARQGALQKNRELQFGFGKPVHVIISLARIPVLTDERGENGIPFRDSHGIRWEMHTPQPDCSIKMVE